MTNQDRNQYLEVFKHITRTNPYSIHKSYFDNSCSAALYLHLHPEMELLYLEEGSFTFKIEEKLYPMKAGEAIFVPQKMLHTAILQSETDKKVSEICLLCGFNNISYYNREFLQIMKTTPSKYRAEAQRYKGLAQNEGNN